MDPLLKQSKDAGSYTPRQHEDRIQQHDGAPWTLARCAVPAFGRDLIWPASFSKLSSSWRCAVPPLCLMHNSVCMWTGCGVLDHVAVVLEGRRAIFPARVRLCRRLALGR